jgi:hypothetical protein
MSTVKKVTKWTVVLGLGKLTVSQAIANTKLYIDKMTGNSNFPTPVPLLSVMTTQLNKLDAAYTLAQSKTKGTAAAMRTELKVNNVLLKQLAGYVEAVANSNHDQGVSIIEGAGMNVRKRPVYVPKTFAVVLGKTPGTVLLSTHAVPKSSYLYEMTTDPTLATGWSTVVINQTVKYTKAGLTSGTRYYFRVSVITKGMQASYSPVLNVIIP